MPISSLSQSVQSVQSVQSTQSVQGTGDAASPMGLLTARDGIVGPYLSPTGGKPLKTHANENLAQWPDWSRQFCLLSEILGHVTYEEDPFIV